MAQNFIACDREQELLLPPSLREWLPEEHLAWFVLDAVAEMDLGGFYASYRDDGWGRAAHDPAMMVALFVYAYAIGVRSSRAIERRCHDDVAFRVIAASHAPDQPMIETAIRELEAAGVTETPGVVLADAGYWKNDAIEALCGEGIPTLVAPDADRRKEPRPGRRGGQYDFARRVLASDWGKQLYLRRQGIVEPVFGQVKSNRGANRFLRRGRSAVRSEWRLLTATHNLLKLHRHQLAAA